MGKAVSIGQSHQVMAVLGNNVGWDRFSAEVIQKIINSPKDSGLEFEKFLKQGARVGNYLIDTDAVPNIPDGWEVIEHKKMGEFIWDPSKVLLYTSKCQLAKRGMYENLFGSEVLDEIKDKHLMNANVLDHLLKNINLIPEEWKGKSVLFWGTVYRADGYFDRESGVRCLNFHSDSGWGWGFCSLSAGTIFEGHNHPALILA